MPNDNKSHTQKSILDTKPPTLDDPVYPQTEASSSSATATPSGTHNNTEGSSSHNPMSARKSADSQLGAIPTPTEADLDDDNDSDALGKSTEGEGKKKSLKEVAQENPTQLGDPVSLKAETADSEPTGEDRGALNDGKKTIGRESKL